MLVAFGVILCVTVLEIGLRIAGFFYLSSLNKGTRSASSVEQEYRILCLGESTTALGGSDAYPRQLSQILNSSGSSVRFKVFNKGIPGTNSAVIVSQLEELLETHRPHLVVAMMGVNDNGQTPLYSQVKTDGENFFSNLRTAKLARLLTLHARQKMLERQKEIILKDPAVQGADERYLDDVLRAMGASPKESALFIELGHYLEAHGGKHLAEGIYKKGLRISPKKEWAYKELSRLLSAQERFVEAEKILRSGIAKNKKKFWPYRQLMELYRSRNQQAQALAIIQEAKAFIPQDDPDLLTAEGEILLDAKKPQEAEVLFLKVIAKDPKYLLAYLGLAESYGRRADQERSVETIRNIPYTEEVAFLEVTDKLIGVGNYLAAEELLKKAVAADPLSARLHGGLAILYQKQGQLATAEQYFTKANEIRRYKVNDATVQNYRRLATVVRSKGIDLLCVQYPMCPVANFLQMLPQDAGVVFVDNEASFKNAVGRDGYAFYFTDSFGGDFGHCTKEGNRLLATNIAQKIKEEILMKGR